MWFENIVLSDRSVPLRYDNEKENQRGAHRGRVAFPVDLEIRLRPAQDTWRQHTYPAATRGADGRHVGIHCAEYRQISRHPRWFRRPRSPFHQNSRQQPACPSLRALPTRKRYVHDDVGPQDGQEQASLKHASWKDIVDEHREPPTTHRAAPHTWPAGRDLFPERLERR